MHGISIDDNPDRPVGTKALRRAIAIHWNWTTEYTTQEIGSALGVRPQTVREYLSEPPSDDVQAVMNNVEAEVRLAAVAELKDQLKRAGHRSRTAETPVKVWTDDDGNLRVNDKRNPETGELTGKYPVPADMELGADDEARFYARKEVREILAQLVEITGAAEPEKREIEHTGDGLEVNISETVVESSEYDADS